MWLIQFTVRYSIPIFIGRAVGSTPSGDTDYSVSFSVSLKYTLTPKLTLI